MGRKRVAPVGRKLTVANAGSGTITLRACGIPGTDDGYYVVPVVLDPGAPRISTLPYLADNQDLSRCAAGCFAATHAQSPVPYYSLHQPRSDSSRRTRSGSQVVSINPLVLGGGDPSAPRLTAAPDHCGPPGTCIFNVETDCWDRVRVVSSRE
jgi:hypothetical protein